MDPRLQPLADVLVELVCREIGSAGESELPRRTTEVQRGVFVADEKDTNDGEYNTGATAPNPHP